MSLFVTRRAGQQYFLLPHSASLDLNSLVLIALHCISCLLERSNGGDCHLGTAHSNTTQGRYLLCSFQMLFKSAYVESCPSICLPCLLCYLCFHPPSLHFSSHLFSGLHHVGNVIAVYTVAGGTDKTRELSQSLFFCMSLSLVFRCGA